MTVFHFLNCIWHEDCYARLKEIDRSCKVNKSQLSLPMIDWKLKRMHWFSDPFPEFLWPFESTCNKRHVLVYWWSPILICCHHLLIKYDLSFIQFFFVHLQQDGILVFKVWVNKRTVQQRTKTVQKLEGLKKIQNVQFCLELKILNVMLTNQ